MRRFTFFAALGVLTVLLLPSALFWQRDARADGTPAGSPLPGLTAEQLAAFDAGLDEFEEVDTAAEGLGPVFNGKSCAECHAQPVVGGSSPELVVSREIRIAFVDENGNFNPLTELGGSLLQQRSIREELPDCPVNGETVPGAANRVSLRITTPLFGAGLMEAIPEATIIEFEDPADSNGDGISGVANRVFNPDPLEFGGQSVQVGRFGWKAQVPTLH